MSSAPGQVAQATALRVLRDGIWRPTRQVATEGRIGPATTRLALERLECDGRVERRLTSLDGRLRSVWRATDIPTLAVGLECGVCSRPGRDVCDECWVNGGGFVPGGSVAGGAVAGGAVAGGGAW